MQKSPEASRLRAFRSGLAEAESRGYSAASPPSALLHAELAYSSRSRANFSWVDLNRAILAAMSARSWARRSSCFSFCATDPLCSGLISGESG